MSSKNLGEKHISNNESKADFEDNHKHVHKHGLAECNCGHHHGESKAIITEKNHDCGNEHHHDNHHQHHHHDESCSCAGHNSSHISVDSRDTGGSIPLDLKDKAQSFVVSGVD